MASTSCDAVCGTLRESHHLDSFLLRNVKPTGKMLGSGSYGEVEELEVAGLVCAGKKIYDALVDSQNLGAQRLMDRYYSECTLLSELRHPHIVQFLGLCFLADTQMPVLVMERLDKNLETFLENMPRVDIPLSTKVCILKDVACGLAFLHDRTPAVIHRDLTARNILLDTNMTAKIADLGNSRMVDFRPGTKYRPLTAIPGTVLYMPPEASDPQNTYDTNLDMFSFGHLSLCTSIRSFPDNLLSPTYQDPITKTVKARNEIERRAMYIDLLERGLTDSSRDLAVLIRECLDFEPTNRPTAREALKRLEALKSAVHDPYTDLSRFQLMIALKEREELVQQLVTEISASSVKMEFLEDQLKQTEVKLEGIYGKQQKMKDLPSPEEETKKEHGLMRALSMKDIRSKLSRKSMLAVKGAHIAALTVQLKEKDMMLHVSGKVPKLPNVKWEEELVTMPLGMEAAQAVIVKEKVYIGGGTTEKSVHKMLEYTHSSGKWREIDTPLHHFGMAEVNDKLIITGGLNKFGITSEVWMLDEASDKWTQPFPNMSSPRLWPSAVGYKRWLLVLSGDSKDGILVEVLDTLSKKWYAACSLPHRDRISRVHACIAQDTLYVVSEHAAFSILVPLLIADAVSQAKLTTAESVKVHAQWKSLPDPPINYPAITAYHSFFLAVGASDHPSSDIIMYLPLTQQWLSVSQLPTPRRGCTAIILEDTDEKGMTMIVMGGKNHNDYIKKVDICTL